MSPWSWWWLEEGEEPHGGWQGDCASREEAIADATRSLEPGTAFDVIEARSSEDRRYEEAECVPFLRTRNRARLVVGLLTA
jgi:hypothetical protein